MTEHFSIILQGKPSHGSSVVEVNTRKLDQLPLNDFAVTDSSVSSPQFGFVMGPACFF